MASVLNYGVVDTISTTLDVSLPTLDYTNDYTVITDVPGECVLSNITGPADQPETIRFAMKNIANVYNKASVQIDPTNYANTKKGKSLVAGIVRTGRFVDTAGVSIDYPIGANTSIFWPVSARVEKEDLRACLLRNASLFYKLATDDDWLNRLMHGSLNPNA